MTRLQYHRAVQVGLGSGLVLLVAAMAIMFLIGQSPWEPVRMSAGILLGPEALSPVSPMDLGLFLTGLLVHFGLSVAYALAITAIVWRMPRTKAIAVGVSLGLFIYILNFYFLIALFPWFAEVRNIISLALHLAFGGLVGYLFKYRARIRRHEHYYPSFWETNA